jgi:peptide/nickel transport system permease protein
MSKVKYFVFRTVQSVFLLWVVLTFLFFFFRLMPGSYSDIMLYQGASQDTVAAFEERWGLNDPLYVQYWRYLRNFVLLDPGTTLQYRQDVWEFVKFRLFNSMILVLPGITAAYIFGVLSGSLMGRLRGSKLEKYGIIPVLMAGTFPAFFTSIVLIIIFASWLGWFPTSGMGTAGFATEQAWWQRYLSWDFAWHYVLPVTAVFLRFAFLPTLIMRTSVVEVMGQDFMDFHRINGISKLRQYRHLGKNSILPVITMYPISATRSIGGLVLVEVVFNWPGIGFSLVEGVLSRDFPLIQFIFFLVAAFIIFANYAVDVIYGFIDPRVSLTDSD